MLFNTEQIVEERGVCQAMYTIQSDRERALIRLRVWGFWTGETMAAYQRDLLAAIQSLPPTPGGHLTLCDISDAAIQSQDIMAAFQAFILRTPRRSRRIAYYTSSPLSRMQAKRLAGGRDDRSVFDSVEAAEAWLFAKDARAA